MTDKEQKLMDYTLAALASIHDAISQADVRPLADALRKLTAMQVLIEAPEVKKPAEYETPEKTKFDAVALNIIKEPIADDVLYEDEKEKVEKVGPLIVEMKKPKKVRLNDYDTPLDVKEAGTSRDEKILYYRAQGKTLAWIAKQVGCATQTVANVIARKKQKEAQTLKSEAAYAHVQRRKP